MRNRAIRLVCTANFASREAAQEFTGGRQQSLFCRRSGRRGPRGRGCAPGCRFLRGYAYQTVAAALAWLDIDERGQLYLEVAEDYAIVAKQALSAVQVRDTEGSGSVTLNSVNIRDAIAAFVDLVGRNPNVSVDLRYFTTSVIGTEQAIVDRPAGIAGLEYWRKAASRADPSPLRAILESEKFPEPVRAFVNARDDAALRRDLLQKIRES